MTRGKDERSNPNRRVDPEMLLERRAYEQLARTGRVPFIDVPVEDHPDFQDKIRPIAEELRRMEEEDALEASADHDGVSPYLRTSNNPEQDY
jgi:hypothetical protein